MRIENKLYILIAVSFIGLFIIFSGLSSGNGLFSKNKFVSLTGGSIVDFSDSFSQGEMLEGSIILSVPNKLNEEEIYGMAILTFPNKEIIYKTFKITELLGEGDKKKVVHIQEIIPYRFEEEGEYELLISILELDLNYKKSFYVD